MDQTEQLLKDLTEAHGVPGYEAEVRAVLRRYMEPLGEMSQDKLGSLICHQPGDGPRVMLAGHMDEIGFMVTYVTDDGFIKFLPLGGWWDQVLLGQRVIVKTHKGDVLGVIGAKPPHLLSADERNKLVEKKDMYVDIGATSRDEVTAAGVRVGDPMVPASDFAILANPQTYMAKAFDNRVGCATVIKTLQHFKGDAKRPNDLYGVQTVMEEVGVRGATTSVHAVNPDVAIIVESDIAGDLPGIRPEQSSVRLGGGPALLLLDARMIPHVKLRDLVIDTAAQEGIPLQFSNMPGGGTDGGAIHLHGTGVPTVVMGVPTRHIHGHNAIINRHDFDLAVQLLTAVVSRLDAATVAGLTQ